jgi:hypothetical protein
LNQPRTCWTFAAVIQSSFPEDIEEDILNQVLGLRGIAENPSADAPDLFSVPTKKVRESFAVPLSNHVKENLVGFFWNLRQSRRGFLRIL